MNAGGGPTFQRRWRRFVLRTQGQLDGDGADRILPWSLAIVAFALLLALDAAAIRTYNGGSGLSPWLQAAWRREHGMAGTPLGGLDPARSTWSLVSEPVLWACRWVPAEAVFAIVQAFVVASGIVPLWRIARREASLRVGATAVVVAAYVLAPTLQRTNLSAFHPEVVALPALLGAYLHGRRAHWVRYGLLVALVLASRADLGLTVVGLGALIVFAGHRRAGIVTALSGLAWTTAAVVVLDPQLPTQALTPAGEFVARATTPLAVVPQLVAHPIDQAHALLAEPSVAFLVVVLAPLLFLPLVAPRKLAAAMPCLSLAMIADTAVQEVAQRGVVDLSPAAAHVAPAMAFVFLALVYALERVGERSVTRVNVDRRLLWALLAGSVLFFLTAAPTSPYEEPWTWGGRDAVDGARIEAVAPIASGDAVAVSPRTTVLVAERAEVVELPLDPVDLTPARVRRISQAVDVIVLDTTPTVPGTDEPYWPPREIRRVLAAFGEEGFAPAYVAQGIYRLEPAAQEPERASG